MGSAPQEQVLSALEPLLSTLDRAPAPLPPQTAFAPNSGSDITDTMDVAQGKLCMGFTTPVTNRCEDMPAMQMLNAILGAGMTSKLFLHIRERMSLCYSIDSAYYGSKGILLMNAGIDFDKESTVREEVLRQLQACRDGDITDEEMTAAREAILSSLRAVHDSPGSIESFYATAALSATILDWEGYLQAVEAVTREDVVRCARSLTLNSTYFLKGVQQ